ncbi:MAG: hypothetical protein ACOVSR_15410, partial [Bacteroidia bacterium]
RKFMIRPIYLILLFYLTACGTKSADKKVVEVDTIKVDTAIGIQNKVMPENIAIAETSELDSATYFVVVADTSTDYYMLHTKMFDLHSKLNLPIDTMRRYYNKAKNLIALPETDQDEVYAGDYYPRRNPSVNLSLEYLNIYQRQSGEKTIALVTGIYETEKSADSALTVLDKTEKKVFKVKAELYMGCIH